MRQERSWIIRLILLILTFCAILFVIHYLTNTAFESTSRALEKRIITITPEEEVTRVETDFKALMIAYKKHKLGRKNLESLSKMVQQADKDRVFTEDEAKEIITFIEKITPTLK